LRQSVVGKHCRQGKCTEVAALQFVHFVSDALLSNVDRDAAIFFEYYHAE
jgi:hypothetical protein